MRLGSSFSRRSWVLTTAVATAATLGFAPHEVSPGQKPDQKAEQKKPSISLRANPPVGFSPLRVVVTAELKGGSDDYEDFYCASVEWDWGDDTKSESKADCDPYEAGKSEIRRRFTAEHTFRAMTTNDIPGAGAGMPTGPTQFRVRFLLKQKNKTVGSGQTTVEIRSGMGG